MDLKSDYHVHSNYNNHSSPDMSVVNVIKKAEKIDLKTIAFTEHVRKTSDWIPRYLEEINNGMNSETSLKIIPGFEAKILKNGTVDFPDSYLGYFLVASFHTRYDKKDEWINALSSVIETSYVRVIGHLAPEETFSLEEDEIEHIAQLIKKNNKTVELNAKYKRPPQKWVSIFKKKEINFHLGSDAHRLEDVGNFCSINDLIKFTNS